MDAGFTMVGGTNPPLAERLARRLLRAEAADPAPSFAASAATATQAYAQLRAHLALFLGENGFDALWRRAIYLARHASAGWADVADDGLAAHLPPGLQAALCADDAAATHARLTTAFAAFIALLFTFIGEDLGLRLLYQAWPDLPPDAADAPAERANP
jgi:hypothetical protein